MSRLIQAHQIEINPSYNLLMRKFGLKFSDPQLEVEYLAKKQANARPIHIVPKLIKLNLLVNPNLPFRL